MVMGSPCPSIPVMIVGAILTAILIFVGVQLIPESDITTQETTTQEATKKETKKKEETKQDFNPVKEMQVFTRVLMVILPFFAGCNAWFLVRLYKLYAY